MGGDRSIASGAPSLFLRRMRLVSEKDLEEVLRPLCLNNPNDRAFLQQHALLPVGEIRQGMYLRKFPIAVWDGETWVIVYEHRWITNNGGY